IAPNKAILVVGEVNTGDDKPKIFPQEIMPLEDALRRYTKQVHLRLHTAHLTPDQLDLIHEMVAGFSGKCPSVLYHSQSWFGFPAPWRASGRCRVHFGVVGFLSDGPVRGLSPIGAVNTADSLKSR